MRRIDPVLVAVLLVMGGLLFPYGDKPGSAQDETATTSKDVKEEAKEAADTAITYTQEQKGAYKKYIESKLKEYEQKLDELKAKGQKLTGDAKADLDQKLETLRKNRDAAYEKLETLKSKSGKAWEEIKSGIDSAMVELKKAYHKVISYFE